jgi:membrane protein
MISTIIPRLRQRFRPLDRVMTLNERVGAIGGGPLSASVALAGFLSLFPLLLVGIAVLGFFSANDVDFAREVVDQLGLEGRAADTVTEAIRTAQHSRRTATVIGFVTLLWAGLGLVGAVSNAVNAAWQVRGRGLTGKLSELTWLVGAAVLLLISVSSAPLLLFLPGPAAIPSVIVGTGLGVLLFLWTFNHLANVKVPWRAHLPGAIVGAIGLEILKLVAGYYVPKAVASSSALYGSLGVVFALLAWFVLSAKLLVYSAVLNVIRWERQHGTVTVEIQVPHIEGQVPLDATRGGAVATSARARARTA